MSLFLCLTRRGSPPHHPPASLLAGLCQSSLSPLPFVRVILSPTTRCDAAECGTRGDTACYTPTHQRNNGDETQGRKRSRGLSGRSVRERVRVLRSASVDTATPTSPWRFKYKRRRVRRRRCRRHHHDFFPAHLGYRMRVTHRWVSSLRGSGPSHWFHFYTRGINKSNERGTEHTLS